MARLLVQYFVNLQQWKFAKQHLYTICQGRLKILPNSKYLNSQNGQILWDFFQSLNISQNLVTLYWFGNVGKLQVPVSGRRTGGVDQPDPLHPLASPVHLCREHHQVQGGTSGQRDLGEVQALGIQVQQRQLRQGSAKAWRTKGEIWWSQWA